MAKDKRLYMTFPLDFPKHVKVARLPVEARWVFVEMNAEARLADNDGVFSSEDAEFLWPAETLAALVGSHPTRPLVMRDQAGNYVIREYAKHQHTKADREALSKKRSDAALARWGKQGQSTGDASALQEQSNFLQPNAQSQSQSQDLLLTESVSLGSNARDEMTDSKERQEGSERLAAAMRLDLGKVISAAARLDRELDHGQALRLSTIIIAKAPTEPESATAYVLGSFKRGPLEVQNIIDKEVLA